MQSMPNAGLWAGLGNAQIFEHGTYFAPGGIYDVEIVRCLQKATQKSGLAFIVECEVMTSTSPVDPSGSKRTWFQSLKNVNVGHGAVAGFLLQVFGLENNAARKLDFFPYLEGFIGRVAGPENILSGMVVHLETSMIKTKEKGADFTRHDWSKFDYDGARSVGLDLSAPVWEAYRDQKPAFVAPPSGPSLPPGAQLSPDGRSYWTPGMTAWAPLSSMAPPPPPPAPKPWDMPGVMKSPDGNYYLVNGAWLAIPR